MDELIYSVQNHHARIVLSQPAKLNAISSAMWEDLPKRIVEASENPEVRCIVLEGAGDKAFSAGADISQFGDIRSDRDAVLAYDRALDIATGALAEASKPTIALIRGICFGAGFGLAMACDVRMVRADARFRIPAARLGIGYSFEGTSMLARKMGEGVVADLLISARILDAAGALRRGIATEVFSPETFEAECEQYLADVVGNAPLSLLATKGALNEIARQDGPPKLDKIDLLISHCFESADYREGRAAFQERRLPQFIGA